MIKAQKIFKTVFIVLLAIYVLVIAKLALNRIQLDVYSMRLVPFNTMREYLGGEKSLSFMMINYIGNFAMFFPLGIFLPVIFSKLKFKTTVLMGFVISLGIEAFQYITSKGYVDIDDVIFNVLGIAVGAFLYFYVLGGKKKSIASYVLSLIFIVVFGVSGIASVWYLHPEMLPQNMVAYGGMIGGEKIDDYDMQANAYKMSHGEIFIKSKTAKDKYGNKIDNARGQYLFTDTAIFIVKETDGEKVSYKTMDMEDMINKITQSGNTDVLIWFNDKQECSMLAVE